MIVRLCDCMIVYVIRTITQFYNHTIKNKMFDYFCPPTYLLDAFCQRKVVLTTEFSVILFQFLLKYFYKSNRIQRIGEI